MADRAPSDVIESPSADAREDPGGSRVVVAVLALTTTFLSTVDATIVATALSAIHHNLHSTINWAGWTITVYSLGVVVSLPTAGRLANQLGQRRVFLWALAIFTAGSLLCGLSTNIYELIAFRAVQSFGGGALSPTAAGIISTYFGRGRDRAIGLFSSIGALGQFMGPVLGGVFVGYLSWHWIFFVNVPICVVILALVPRFITESHARGSQRIDVAGMALLAVFILLSTLAITNLGDRNSSGAEFVVVPAIFAAATLTVFIRHNRRASDPFVPLPLLYGRGFGSINLLNFLWGFAGWGMATLVPLYAQDRYGLPALNSGALLSSRALTMFIFGFFAAMALRRTGYRLPMTVGYMFTVAGMLMMTFSPRGLGPFGWLAIAAGLTGVGNGLASPSSRNAGLELVPDEVASTTGLRFMFNSIGTIYSVSIVTAILNRSSDPGLVQAHIILVMAAIIGLVMIPLVRGIPEHKGAW
jgi:EmrB/QacA subfamily drug resistance transporter